MRSSWIRARSPTAAKTKIDKAHKVEKQKGKVEIQDRRGRQMFTQQKLNLKAQEQPAIFQSAKTPAEHVS